MEYIFLDSIQYISQKTEVDLGRARYKITDGHCVSPPGNPTKGKYLQEGRQDGGDDELDNYWKGIIWQRILQDRQMWKQHAEAFAQPRDTVAA